MTGILLVDGDPCQAPVLAKMLQRYGHSVVHEIGLSEVDKYLGTYEMAMVAPDDLDGELRGIPALRELRTKIRSGLRPQTPIFTIFDHASSLEERYEALMGGDAFLDRPFLREEILGAVENLAKQRGCYGHISGVVAAIETNTRRDIHRHL